MKNLKKYRELRGFTMQQVAQELGVCTKTIANYEIGAREPNLEKMTKISKHLGVSIDALIDVDISNDLVLSNEEKFLITKYRIINQQHKTRIRGFLQEYLNREGK